MLENGEKLAKVGLISLAVFLKRPQAELKSALNLF
jgi:hypothetical protein